MFPLNTIVIMLFVALWDWVAMDRFAGYFFGNPYRYWPLTRPRLASVVLLEIAAVSGCFFPDRYLFWWLALFLITLGLWSVIAFRDITTKP